MRQCKWMVALVLVAGACGEEDKPAGKPSNTALESKVVADLDSADQAALCVSLVELADSLVTDEAFCTEDAVFLSSTSDECEEERDACIAEEASITAEEECEDFTVSKSCKVKVSELRSCVSALNKQYAATAKLASCEDLEEPEEEEDLPAACKDLPPSCIEVEVDLDAVTNSKAIAKTWRRN